MQNFAHGYSIIFAEVFYFDQATHKQAIDKFGLAQQVFLSEPTKGKPLIGKVVLPLSQNLRAASEFRTDLSIHDYTRSFKKFFNSLFYTITGYCTRRGLNSYISYIVRQIFFHKSFHRHRLGKIVSLIDIAAHFLQKMHLFNRFHSL